MSKIFRFRNRREEEDSPGGISYERWTAGFSQPEHTRFSIKSENSYDANIQKRGEDAALVLSLRKSGSLAWAENSARRYADLVLEGRIRLETYGGYAASGFMFRVVDDSTYYLALVSSKGYFRLDLVLNGTYRTLAGWTELPGVLPETETGARGLTFTLTVAAYGSHIVMAVNSLKALEIRDASIPAGYIAFAAVSYAASGGARSRIARAFLEALTVESRIGEVEAAYAYWSADDAPSDPRHYLHLAETFAAMGKPAAALEQLSLGWAWTANRGGGEGRNARELLLAAHLALEIGLYPEAEEYLDACMKPDDGPGWKREALVEKARLLYRTRRFTELKAHCEDAAALLGDDAEVLSFLGHAHRELAGYGEAARAYDRAFEADSRDALMARNAARAWERAGDRGKAQDRRLKAGRAFLAAEDYAGLDGLLREALALEPDNWELHALAGKRAFGIGDWETAKAGFEEAERLRLRPQADTDAPPPPDPALVFLRGLLLAREGKRAEALSFLEEAALLEPDYPLFRFRLAENRFLLNGDAGDPKFKADLDTALSLDPENGWAHNLAAQAALARNDTDEAAFRLEEAARLLGEEPAVRLNRAELLARRDRLDEALALLDTAPGEDAEGAMAHYAGELLSREGRFAEAADWYDRATAAAPENAAYLCDRAACLMETDRFGEAGALLARAHSLGPTPGILEQIARVAAKMGEYPRAEAACKAALELDGGYAPALLTLGAIYAARLRWDETAEVLRKLDALPSAAPPDENARKRLDNRHLDKRREELRARLEEAAFRLIPCASCGRSWRVSKPPEPPRPIRLFAMPPDELPAGSCPACGKTWCIGCAKQSLDDSGRFLCPFCGLPLKLSDGGLGRIVYEWAEKEVGRSIEDNR